MAETPMPEAGAAETAAVQPTVKLLAHFTRDLSFENVGAREGTTAEGTPEIAVNVGMDAKKLTDDRYII
ncbi:MAG: protein-export chaperone SecB, partial [Pseudomonadota bacterium]